MRKFYIILTGILFILLFTTCQQFTADIDDYLGYWSSQAFILNSTIDKKTYNDANGIVSVASADDVTITLKVQNPKSFRFVMPSASETRNIVGFAHFAGTKPAAGTDYELTQLTADTLQLVYKNSFLKNSEWGEKDISSTITLYANDGRPPFKQTFTIPLKANTPPPKPGYAVAKMKETPAYYVLCITVPDMDKTVPGGLLHKDLARIEINGTPYTFSVNEAQTAFTKPEADVFITHSAVEKLNEPDADNVPPGGWVLFYKTDVEVKDGAAKKDYTIKLIDKKGLASGIVNASTKPNKPKIEKPKIKKGTEISGSGNSVGDPVIIRTDSSGAEITVSSSPAHTTVYCTLAESGSTTPSSYNGNPVTVPLPLKDAGEKLYKLKYYAKGEGFAATPEQTVYYKVVKGHTVRFNANEGAYPGGATVVSKTALYGTKISPPDPLPEKQGYGVTGWYKDKACSAGQAWNFATDTVTGDMPLYAQWTAGADTPYKVEHYQEELDGTYPSSATETEYKTGTTDASISADSIKKNYEGFDYDHIDPTDPTIGADRKTVVKVYYKRKTYTVNFSVENSVGGTLTAKVDASNIQSGNTVEHGKKVTFTAAPARGWHIDSWTVSTGSFESGGGTGTSATLKVTAEATVKVKFEPDTAFNLASSETGAWKILREEAARTKGPGTIVIDGTITATGGDNAGEITLGRSLTIEGKSGSSTDILDAAGLNRIFKVSSGTLTLKNLTLKNGMAEGPDGPGDGGAIYVHGASVNITNCTLTDNTADKNGGAVYATKRDNNAARVTISGGFINGNTVTINSGFGGGIYINDGCELTLTGGVKVNNNKAARGGGVRANNSNVIMNGCTFEGNKSTHGDASDGCGGVYVNGGTVSMKNCILKNNDGNVRAGGLLIEGGATVTMQDCTLTGNTAATGGGVYVQDGTFTMKGSAIVTPSTGSEQYTPGKNDVYLKTGKTITVDGTLTGTAPVARITPESYTENTPVLTGNITDGSPQNRKKFTVPPQKVTEDSEDWNVFWYIADNGNLKAEVEDPDMLQTVIDGSPNNTIIKLGNISDLKTVKIWVHNTKIMLKADRAVTLTCPSKGNGYKHLQVQEYASLILKGQITLQGADYGSNSQYALYVENWGKAEIKNGVTITGFKNGNIGPVVSDGELTMSGGEISGNKAKNGGGVYIHAAHRSFTMTGGTIKGNLATEHGGGVYVNADGLYNMYGKFTMTGGKIEGNTADKGGGVFTHGIFTMGKEDGGTGGTITKNTATNDGKAVMLDHHFYWEAGKIKDNLGSGSVIGGNTHYYLHNTSGNTES